MRKSPKIPFLIAILVLPGIVNAVDEMDFKVKTTQDLINLCTASEDDPQHAAAIHFCHGYLVGAFHFYKTEHGTDNGNPLFCLPDPKPTRNEAIAMFVGWAQEHSEYMAEIPVETEFRFLVEQWPCSPSTK